MLVRRKRETTVCGLHISGLEIRLAIMRTLTSGKKTVTLEAVVLKSGSMLEQLAAAIEDLRDRHGLKRVPVAVSLDGDFCVTRIHLGTPRAVDQGLEMLSNRIPRYLSLGPGEKISGGFRQSLDKKTDYSVTAVANRETIENIQQTLRGLDMSPRSIEPTMVAVAREIKKLVADDATTLLADGSGSQWDLGIALNGRLLLDYRPSAARDSDRFSTILCEHMSRLHRFCERHRNQSQSQLRDLFVYGTPEKITKLISTLETNGSLNVRALTPRLLLPEYELPAGGDDSVWCGAVLAAITAADISKNLQTADLLTTVRTVRQRSLSYHLAWTLAPIATAAALLLTLHHLDQRETVRKRGLEEHHLSVQDELGRIREAMESVRSSSVRIETLNRIRSHLGDGRLCGRLLRELPQSLPDATKLNRVNLTSDGELRVSGTALDESVVYEAISGLRRMRGVQDVLLQATNPSTDIQSEETEFAITVELSVEDA